MKKFLAFLLTLLTFASFAFADDETTVYVSITDDTGALVLAHEAVAVTDLDADGTLTIADALSAAHIACHENGADAFGMVQSEYGLSLTILWGIDNGGSYGYYLNNASAWSLLDPVTGGDHVKAFAYTDLTDWSDTYCYFSADTVTAAAGAEIPLTLFAAGFDANYAPVTLPVADAVVTVNGEASGVTTDAEGNAVLTISEAGVYVVSATSETMTMVAPVCIVTIE